jgi:predicted PurR-regulated permease PerM
MKAMSSNSPSSFGAMLGAVIALVILLPNFWVVAALAVIGFVIGKLWESEVLRGKIKEMVSHLFS